MVLPVTVIVVPGMLPQAFTAATVIFPVTNAVVMFTVIESVPVPLAIVTPAGSVHVYDVAPNTGAILYIAVLAPHKDDGPEIAPCVPGFLVIDRLAVALVPQLFFAATVYVPITVPAGIVTVIEFP